MPRVRPAAVAGRFYPDDPAALRAAVREYVGDVGRGPSGGTGGPATPPTALIAPHAGYVYSGPVAGTAYAALGGSVRRVLLLGPAHHFAIRGLAVPTADAFATPLGDVPVDAAVVARALELPGVEPDDRVHGPEHSLEVHLPFLQEVLDGGFSVVPIAVGLASDDQVAGIIDTLLDAWPGSLVVVSTDLSHYLPYDDAVDRDRRTALAVDALEPDGLGPEDACGFLPLRGLLRVARTRGWSCETLELMNSGDAGGPRDRVVGYGAFALAAKPSPSTSGSAHAPSSLDRPEA